MNKKINIEIWKTFTRDEKTKNITKCIPTLSKIDFNGYPRRGYHWRHKDLDSLAKELNILEDKNV